jgi:two-component system response regulator HupR/HoxA
MLSRPSSTILVVEDHLSLRWMLQRYLSAYHFVDTVSNAEAAMSILYIDAVLTDNEMPGNSGVWLLEQVYRLWPKTRRMMFSGRPPENVNTLINSGLIEEFIDKPSGLHAVLEKTNPESWR